MLTRIEWLSITIMIYTSKEKWFLKNWKKGEKNLVSVTFSKKISCVLLKFMFESLFVLFYLIKIRINLFFYRFRIKILA